VGLVGSGEYARDQRALLGGGGIGAVYQMDMIGYNKEPPLTYEIHAGSDPGLAIREPSGEYVSVQDKACVLAERIGKLSEQVSPNLPAPQIYLNRGVVEDRDLLYQRSDHYSFNLVRYPACLTIEDFLPENLPSSDRNPHYHTTSDTSIDPEYAADIARAVAAAAWVSANL
jgi:bacterial leucyl aminopeptidase